MYYPRFGELEWLCIGIYWTLFIIVPSVISLFTEKEKVSSLMFLAVGVLLLLAAQGVFSYEVAWKVILAVVLIVVGISIIVKSLIRKNNDKEVEKKIRDMKNDKVMDAQTAIFRGVRESIMMKSLWGRI